MSESIEVGGEERSFEASSSRTTPKKRRLTSETSNDTSESRQEMIQIGEVEEDGTITIQNFQFDQEKGRLYLARMIILHELPFCFVENEGFRGFMKELQPMFKMVSCATVKSDCMKIYDVEKQKLSDLLGNLKSRISLTADLWSSNQNLKYICLTCHYIDDEWHLQKRILAFSSLEAPHTGESIANCILDKLYDWNIDKKLCSIVLDNCSTNDIVVRELKSKLVTKGLLLSKGDVFHVRCCAHILNLIVQDGLYSICETIHKIRESVKYIKHSEAGEQKFNEIAKEVRAPQKIILLDSSNMWNSTYEMLVTVLQFKEVFGRLSDCDSAYKFAPSYEEWKNAERICKCLKEFYDRTDCFSSTNYSTSKFYFPHICELHLLLKDWCNSSEPFLRDVASKMMVKFEKYWNITCMPLAIAAIFDPRLKYKILEYYFPLIYGEDSDARIAEVKSGLMDLYNHYVADSTKNDFDKKNSLNVECSSDSVGSSCAVMRSSSVTSPCNAMIKWDHGLNLFLKKSSNVPRKSNLDWYLDEAIYPTSIGESLDVLAWWKWNEPKYGEVARMARDILAIPVSTVALEFAFSTGGRTIDDYRSSLSSGEVESLICSQDWLRNEGKEDNKSITSNDVENFPLE